MNRRQPRANGGHRTAHLEKAVRCPDCDSVMTVVKVGPRDYRAAVEHDLSCPWLRQFEQDGGYGIRFGTGP